MITREQALAEIDRQLTLLNEELDYDFLEEVNEDTPIYGSGDSLDSLSFMNFLLTIENSLKAKGMTTDLADYEAVMRPDSPYKTAGRFADFIVERAKHKP